FVQERERIRSWILEVEVEGARDDWPENLPEVTVVDRQQARVMLRMNNPEREEELLDAIRASGRLTHYAWRRPSVTELFRGVTNARAQHGKRGAPRALFPPGVWSALSPRETSPPR